MSKQYLVSFGAGNPTLLTGFSPTFTVFKVVPGGGATTPPGITEIPTSTGLYYFQYDPISPIAFVIDGGASLAAVSRYIIGNLDPIQKVDEQGTSLMAYGASLIALGNTILAQGSTTSTVGALIGSLADSFGTTLADPTSVFGYLKRIQENLEGNQVFTKSSGVQQIWSRGTTYVLGASTYPGASTQIRSKTLSDSGSIITKI